MRTQKTGLARTTKELPIMLDFANACISKLIIHFIGNKNNAEEYTLSHQCIDIPSQETEAILLKYFLAPFKERELFHFRHESDLSLNACYTFTQTIFEQPESFTEQTQNIGRHLYECNTHPNIKAGELFIAAIDDCIYEEQNVSVIIIFKSESRDHFLQPVDAGDHFDLSTLSGINTTKVDKGCLIINIAKEDGYKVAVIDNVNRGNEAAYWRDDFLKIIDCENEFFQTNKILGIAKNYITSQYSSDFVVDKTDQIDLLNRSIDYFKSHDSFDQQEFEQEVFHHPQVIDSFRSFNSEYRQKHELDIEDQFQISSLAVKKQSRVFKSVLKLDKNFHIYIHGNKEMIEKGVEADGRKFYKIYYENED